jgi:hypothetical protein
MRFFDYVYVIGSICGLVSFCYLVFKACQVSYWHRRARRALRGNMSRIFDQYTAEQEVNKRERGIEENGGTTYHH